MDTKIDVINLKSGMYVVELDRPWIDTTFIFQGFLIESETQLIELKRQCSYVIVSTERSESGLFPDVKQPLQRPTRPPTQAKSAKPDVTHTDVSQHQATGFFSGLKTILGEALHKRSALHLPETDQRRLQRVTIVAETITKATEEEKKAYIENMRNLRRTFEGAGAENSIVHHYENTTSLEEEVHTAQQIHHDFCNLASSLLDDLSSADFGERIDIAEDLISTVVDSMVRNADAMDFLSRLKGLDDYAYSHAVNVSVRLISFGRQLGFPKDRLQHLGLGGLLLDIGRTRLPLNIARMTDRYTPEEFELEKRHVLEGVDILSIAGSVSSEVIDIVKRHHERHDGSGYPEGVQGEKIGLYGSLAGIVDTYCAMIMKRPYATTMTSANALSAIVDLENKSFHPALVDQFVQTIGIYPVGALVELTSSEIGIVVRQNRLRRLRPTVLVILDSDRQPYPHPATLDLMHTLTTPEGENLSIRQELNQGAYGIDPADYFL